MASQTSGAPGNRTMSDKNNTSLPSSNEILGYVEPIIGRIAHKDVIGYFGFPIIRSGQAVTPAIAERAQSMARLFELMAATSEG